MEPKSPSIYFIEPSTEDGYPVYPHAVLNPPTKFSKSGETPNVQLPPGLLGLTNPSPHQKIAIIRYLAFTVARTLYQTKEYGFGWYQSWYEETQFDDYLEVAIGILAALNVSVISTDAHGSITVKMTPTTDDFKEVFLEFFLPVAHYLRYANPEGDEDFEYNFEEAPYEEAELRSLSKISFFDDHKTIVSFEPIFQMVVENHSHQVVAKKKDGLSTLEAKTGPLSPPERIMKAIIDVLYCFDSSFEIEESEGFSSGDETIEELRQNMLEYIAEFPDEIELAEESFHNQSRGEVEDFEFISEYAVFYSLGISHIRNESPDELQLVLSPPSNIGKYLIDAGLISDERTDILDEFDFDGYVSLGQYEYVFFTSDDDN